MKIQGIDLLGRVGSWLGGKMVSGKEGWIVEKDPGLHLTLTSELECLKSELLCNHWDIC